MANPEIPSLESLLTKAILASPSQETAVEKLVEQANQETKDQREYAAATQAKS